MVLRQLSDLIDYAADEKYGGRVPVRWNFVDDELGNFTKITNMRQQTSFGTGKGIRHFMFIQSYAQLDDVYGEKVQSLVRPPRSAPSVSGTLPEHCLTHYSG